MVRPWWLEENQLDGVPILDGWATKVGKIYDIWATPCDLDPAIIVAAAFSELPVLLYGIFKPQPIDAATYRS